MKLKKIKSIIVPSKKINYFIFSVLMLGIISGCIFLTILSETDKELVTSQISDFTTLVSGNDVDMMGTFYNSLITNVIFAVMLFVLGMTIVGLICNIFIIYIKGFVLGFSLASIIYTLGFKGILVSFLYVFPTQLLNILVILLLGIYSVMFSFNLIRQIRTGKGSGRYLKKYSVIFAFCLIIGMIASGSEAFLLPNLMRLCSGLF